MTRESVMAVAQTVLSHNAGASLKEVASAAGVSRATVYRMFGSRALLLQALELEPDPGSRERALVAALELIGRDGLARLSMDEVAAAAGLSRASLYRMFPGKPALFREVTRVFSPLDTMAETVERMRNRPPHEVMPEIARGAARTMVGRVGIVRTLIFEVTSASVESAEAMRYVLERFMRTMGGYLLGQMAAGSLRPMHPLLAFQAFAGPILFHLIARSVVERELGFDVPIEDAVTALAETWVRAMKPEEER